MVDINWRKIREQAGASLEQVAVSAGVTSTTARLFELAGAQAIKKETKRNALISAYKRLEGAAHAA